MENKQTSIEWLFERFENGDMYNQDDAQFIKHQALKMHKQEIVAAFSTADGLHYTKGADLDMDGHDYYNETYERKTTESK